MRFFHSKHHHKDCLVFFCGWGMDPTPFSAFAGDRFDLFMVYDYTTLDLFPLENLAGQYDQLHLAAWSMGVWAASILLIGTRELFASTTAVNGTLQPIDDACGIGENAYDGVIESFSEESLEGFYQSMLTDPAQVSRFLETRPMRSPDSILEELIALKNLYRDHGSGPDIYDLKLVGSQDRIFPARSQIRSWGRDRCITMKSPHFPFYDWNGIAPTNLTTL